MPVPVHKTKLFYHTCMNQLYKGFIIHMHLCQAIHGFSNIPGHGRGMLQFNLKFY